MEGAVHLKPVKKRGKTEGKGGKSLRLSAALRKISAGR